ncbi:MAG: ABC transporter permease, partial [Verrucomicrobiales bacterium]|nr:ABC transporter permease [Verrucomicrobiales bacterium]
ANAVLWRPVPFAEPNQLVMLGEGDLHSGSRTGVSASNFRDWQEQCRSFSEVAALRTRSLNLAGAGAPERLLGGEISEEYFRMLRIQPELGRLFERTDFVSGDQRLAVLSHRLWKRRFGGNTLIPGQTIRLNGESHIVVGVVPESVESIGSNLDLWTPLVISPEFLANRELQPYSLYARMRPGISLEQTRSEMKTVASRLAAEYPSLYRRLDIWVSPLGMPSEDARPVFLFLLGITGAILLIACANLASLLLVRSVHRQREICVRSALGAGRFRVIRQLLTENLIVAMAGGCAGLLFARWASDLLKYAMPAGLAEELPVLMQFHLDWRVLVFAFVVCAGAALLFGLVPAIESSRVSLSSGLQSGARDLTGGHQARRLSLVFVTAQIALCFATFLFTACVSRAFGRRPRLILVSSQATC